MTFLELPLWLCMSAQLLMLLWSFFHLLCFCIIDTSFLNTKFAEMFFEELNPSVGTIWFSVFPFTPENVQRKKGNRNHYYFQ